MKLQLKLDKGFMADKFKDYSREKMKLGFGLDIQKKRINVRSNGKDENKNSSWRISP